MAATRGKVVAAIDQGTTSSRTLIVARGEGGRGAEVLGWASVEHRQITPGPGLVEHDPAELLQGVVRSFKQACDAAGIQPESVSGIGITNQRETTLVWDRRTGSSLCNALVWQDTRTRGICEQLGSQDPRGKDILRELTGLPLATYFSGPKVTWVLEHVAGARAAAERGELAFGTVETYLLWHLTGGVHGGTHLTDVTNASRTLMMGLRSLDWEPDAMRLLGVPRAMLPTIVPNTPARGTHFGVTRREVLGADIPVVALIGDQQSALVGQACLSPGEMKNTYGTGCFLLLNTGTWPVRSSHGLLTTLAYRFGDAPAHYALEGSIAVAGSLVQWLRDNLGLIASSEEMEGLARSVPDAGGAVIVPAFSGLFAPWWDASARGALLGLTRHTSRAHVARAALEATAFQAVDVLRAMEADSARITHLKADGGMTANRLLMQLQADLSGLPVTLAANRETTALGAAYAAMVALGWVSSVSDIASMYRAGETFTPAITASERSRRHGEWLKAVERCRGWERV